MKATYNKSTIMTRAWRLFKAQEIRTMEMFNTCLTQSWNIAKNGIKDIDIDKIYNKYYQQVYYSILMRVGGKTEIAEELANDVFLKANRHLQKYDVMTAKLNTWLIMIAKNIVIDYYRTNKADNYINVGEFTDSEGKEFFEFSDNSTMDNVENMELLDKINAAINKLKPNYRQVAKLFFIEEKKHTEIATQLNIPLGSVKAIISRCKTKLQLELKTHRI